ncbi:MAG: ABC transporter permease [Planctomycetota bacterium]|nr:ABC transporter permease [Planctomycetota bacterium]
MFDRFKEAPLARTVGGLFIALIVWVIARGQLSLEGALVLSLGIGALAALFVADILISRVIWTVPMVAVLIQFSIILMFLAPGDPFASEKNAPEAVVQQQKEQYGIDPSPFTFFGRYMKNLIVDGYLGPSISWRGRSVTDLLMPALPVSMSLGLLALTIASGIGLLLGLRAGVKPNSFTDYSSMGLALIGISLPNFVIGAFLMLMLAIWTGWLPVAGWGSYRHLIMPAITLALPFAAYIARLARSGAVEVMHEDYIRTARAKGLPEREVVGKHAFKLSILPVVSFLGPGTANLMTGSFVVEILFGVPGMGQYFVKGAINRDYYVVLGTLLIYVFIVVTMNLLVDLAYSWLDPRVRKTT